MSSLKICLFDFDVCIFVYQIKIKVMKKQFHIYYTSKKGRITEGCLEVFATNYKKAEEGAKLRFQLQGYGDEIIEEVFEI